MKLYRETVEKLLKEATPGPWGWEQPGEKENGFCVWGFEPPTRGLVQPPYDDNGDYNEDAPVTVDFVCEQWGATVNYTDAALIAAAPDLARALLDAWNKIDALKDTSDATNTYLRALADGTSGEGAMDILFDALPAETREVLGLVGDRLGRDARENDDG